jgi:RNA recognition motif-containing protein
VKRVEDERRKNIAPSETLFVVNFHEATTKKEDLELLFEPFGKLLRIDLKRNYAFIQYATIAEATAAKEATNGGRLDQSVLTVEYVAQQRDNEGPRNSSSSGMNRNMNRGPRDRDRDRDRNRSSEVYRDRDRDRLRDNVSVHNDRGSGRMSSIMDRDGGLSSGGGIGGSVGVPQRYYSSDPPVPSYEYRGGVVGSRGDVGMMDRGRSEHRLGDVYRQNVYDSDRYTDRRDIPLPQVPLYQEPRRVVGRSRSRSPPPLEAYQRRRYADDQDRILLRDEYRGPVSSSNSSHYDRIGSGTARYRDSGAGSSSFNDRDVRGYRN